MAVLWSSGKLSFSAFFNKSASLPRLKRVLGANGVMQDRQWKLVYAL